MMKGFMSDRVRIVYFITSLESGGTERQLALLLENLPSAKYEKHILCLSGLGPLKERFEKCTDSIQDLQYPRLRHNGRLVLKNLPFTVTSVFKLYKSLRRLRPDILHSLIPVCNVMGAIAGKLARVPVIVSSRLSLGNYRDDNRLFARLEDFSDRFFALIHCKSEGIRDDVIRREPVDPDDLRIIYNGINTDAFGVPFHAEPLRQEFGIPEGAAVIGMVANLKAYKGHADVIAAAPEILQHHPQTRFLFVGRDDGILDELKKQARDLGVLEHVIFAGERHDVPRLLQLMTILISASHEEGFSNTILEAMATGLPVIATRVGGNLEQVADGINGYLVMPSSPGELAEAAIALLNDPDQARRMGRQSSIRVARNFSIRAVADQMEEFYREAIGLTE